MRYFSPCIALFISATLAACGGGSSSPNSLPAAPSQSAARQLVVAFAGTSSLVRRTMTLSGTTVTVTLNGKIIGTGQLDSSGQVSIKIDESIPAGSTLTITAGSTTATIVWNQTNEDAAVLVQVNADGTLNVSVASGDHPEASPAPDDPNGSNDNEDANGAPLSVNDDDGNAALPADLPISVVSSCTSLTITPLSPKIASMRFEENVRDGDGGSKFKYEGPFTSTMTFPLVAQSARLEIRLFDSANAQLLDVKAPIDAFTAQPGQPTPAACPSASPQPQTSPGPSASPEPGESPSPSRSVTP